MRGAAWPLVVCLVGLLVVTASGGAASGGPTVEVTVDGQELVGTDAIVVNDDPTAVVNVTATESIDSVSVRVDGETRASFTPDTRSFSTEVTLDLDEGEHRLTVVTSANSTTSVSGTVIMDSTGPRASYVSPFTTDRNRPPDRVTVSEANVTLAASLFDTTGVSHVRIRWRYEYEFAGTTELARQTYRIENPGENFSQPLLLGLGENQLTVILTDDHGQIRRHETVLTVRDDQKPSITVRRVQRLSAERVRIAGTVSDNVKINNLLIRPKGHSGGDVLIRSTDREPERGRLSREFNTTVSVTQDTDSVQLIAEDIANNRQTRSVSLDFDRQIEPRISVTEAALTADGRVRVVGTVDQGRISNVNVETVGENGTVALTTVYSGDPTDEVAIDTKLRATGAETEVRVRVIDSRGREHTETVRVMATRGTANTRSTTQPNTETRSSEQAVTSEETAAAGGTSSRTAAESQDGEGGIPSVVLGLLTAAGVVGLWVVSRVHGDAGSGGDSGSTAGSVDSEDAVGGDTSASEGGDTRIYDPDE